MDRYQPTFESKETAWNIGDFLDATKAEFWKIFKPLMPFIAACHILDAVISDLFFAESKNGFSLFSIIAAYFVTALVITWHRVVIHGSDNYTPMNPFKPKRHELVFVGMGFLLGLVIVVIDNGLVFGTTVTDSSIMILIAAVVSCALIYMFYRVCFYFPAMAVNAGITLSQAFRLTQGYVWKIISSTFRAAFSFILMLVVFIFAMGMLLVLVSVVFPLPFGSVPAILGLFITLPVKLYFVPLLTIIGVTALSNYYLYAIQNEEGAVEG